ncbi:MAG: conjugal transfer protein TraN [Azonexus sp.]|jgi:conjugal transfer mating pair stabilization protein TraN|nr:conjugal transfer protein TraN [Azonexus sp.]
MKNRLAPPLAAALLSVLMMVGSTARAADPASAAEGRDAGQAARSSLLGSAAVSGGRDLVEEMTPGFTASPPETMVREENFSAEGAARISDCAAAADPDDVACEAINTSHADSAGRLGAADAMRNDPSVLQAVDDTRNALSSGGLGGLTAAYNDCAEEELDKGIQTRDIQFCHNYYLRTLDHSCTKRRIIQVTWSCPPGSDGPYQSGSSSPHFCERVAETLATCAPSQTLSPGGDVCFDDETGEESAPELVDEIEQFTATPHILESWINPCAGFESRVPPEALQPDGEPTIDVSFGPTGRLDKCIRNTSICTDEFPQTRNINGLDVTRSCWAYTNNFDCVSMDDKSDCNQPRFGSCSSAGTECIDTDIADGFCTAEKVSFDCSLRDTTRTETRLNCGAQIFTDREGNEWDVSHEPDPDFLAVVTFMEAGRESGRYMDPDRFTVFNGVENTCKKKLFGLVNCCNRSGIGSEMFNNLALATGMTGGVSGAGQSNYMFDGLFAGDMPQWPKTGLGGILGGGDTFGSVSQLMNIVDPGRWAVAMQMSQLAGMLTCEEDEKVLSMKRDSDLCVDNGSRCSKRLRVIRTCIERTYSYCCFNSRLAKLINRQGRAQLGISNSSCAGFTLDQLQSLDLSAMDFSEFMDEIQAAAIEMPVIAPERLGNCEAGGGAC